MSDGTGGIAFRPDGGYSSLPGYKDPCPSMPPQRVIIYRPIEFKGMQAGEMLVPAGEYTNTSQAKEIRVDVDPAAQPEKQPKCVSPKRGRKITHAGLREELDKAPEQAPTPAQKETAERDPSYVRMWLNRSQSRYEIQSMRASQKRKDARAQYRFSGGSQVSPEKQAERRQELDDAQEHCKKDYVERCSANADYALHIQNSMAVRAGLCDGIWLHIQNMAERGDEKAKLLVKIENLPELAERSAKALAREIHNKMDRLENGYQWKGGFVADNPNYYREPFVYLGLRSDEHHLLQLFVTKLNRKTRLRVGSKKEDSITPESKLDGLDMEYVSGNALMPGYIRADIDADFLSWTDLREQIRRRGCPMPNILVGHIQPDGTVLHPHLIWLVKDSVSAAGHSAPKNLMRGIERGLCAMLLDMGADPGAISNPLRVKNPLCPMWSYCIGEELPYRLQACPELDAKEPLPSLREHVNIHTRMADLERGKVCMTGQTERSESNKLWIEMVRWAQQNVHEFRDTRKESVRDFERAIEKAEFEGKDRDLDVYRKARLIAAWMYENYRLPKPRLSAEKVKEAQRTAARKTSQSVSRRNAEAVRKAAAHLRDKGFKVTKAEVARDTGLSAKTVASHWGEVEKGEASEVKTETTGGGCGVGEGDSTVIPSKNFGLPMIKRHKLSGGSTQETTLPATPPLAVLSPPPPSPPAPTEAPPVVPPHSTRPPVPFARARKAPTPPAQAPEPDILQDALDLIAAFEAADRARDRPELCDSAPFVAYCAWKHTHRAEYTAWATALPH